MGFDILELPEIPRERDKLKAIIGQARYERRKSQLMRLSAGVIMCVAVLILLIGACSAPVPSLPSAVYLPAITR